MRRTMRQIERELMKLEAELGTAAEAQYLDARLALESQLRELYRRSREERWPVTVYLEEWAKLHATLPRHAEVPGEADALRQELMDKLSQTRDRLHQRGVQLD